MAPAESNNLIHITFLNRNATQIKAELIMPINSTISVPSPYKNILITSTIL